MSETAGESLAATPDRLEQALVGTKELMNMGHHLLSHMRDEDRWGGANNDFAPIDLVLAATEVAHDHTIGESSATKIHISERLPARITFDIFVGFWMPRVAAVAYGEEYADEVNAILQTASLNSAK